MTIGRRLFQIVSFLLLCQFFIFIVHGTEIMKENVDIALGKTSKVQVTLFYRELSSDKLSYLVPYDVQKFSAKDSFGELKCTIRILTIGTEFLCSPTLKENYTVQLSFQTSDLITEKDKIQYFGYQHNIVDPTRLYSLRVQLPEGYVIYSNNKSSFIPVDPATGIIGSTGRQITVAWTKDQIDLGTTLHFNIYYEKIGIFGSFPVYVLIPIGIIFAIFIAFFVINSHHNTTKKEGSISALLPALTEDERTVIEFIIQKDKKCTQRDLVKGLNLSKAKASRLVQNLESRDLLKKVKKGRTNILTIEREIGKLGEKSTH